ncbi:MAG: serine dehydratase [bacterium TMED198]|nr:MAG: serine dehydratase [bacterium TMED198]
MVSIEKINQAHDRINSFIHRTPIMTSSSLNSVSNSKLFFKCENFQKAGSFKIRGASNAVGLLTKDDIARGIATTSSGNHGAALSMAGSNAGASVTVVMPNNSPKIKADNVKRNRGKIVWCEPNQKSREETLKLLIKNENRTIVHPYNDERIIAGQATVAKEILEDISDLDAIVSPVSGGGLISGILCFAKQLRSNIKVYGAEPSEADDAYRSIKEGKIVSNKSTNTICDGLRAQIGTITFPIVSSMCDGILRVDEDEIIESMKMIWDRMKIIAEPSSAITLASVLKNKALFENKKVGLVLSGGNSDLSELPWAG